MDEAPLHKTDLFKLSLQAYYDHLNTPRRRYPQATPIRAIFCPSKPRVTPITETPNWESPSNDYLPSRFRAR